MPVRFSGTNLALARVRGWGKGSNYLESSCVRSTARCFWLTRVIQGHTWSFRVTPKFPTAYLGGSGSFGVKIKVPFPGPFRVKKIRGSFRVGGSFRVINNRQCHLEPYKYDLEDPEDPEGYSGSKGHSGSKLYGRLSKNHRHFTRRKFRVLPKQNKK